MKTESEWVWITVGPNRSVLKKKSDLEKQNSSLAINSYLTDEIPPAKHPVTGEIISSRARWNEANRVTGQIEHKGQIERRKPDEKAIRADVDQAMERAIYAAENNASILSDDARAAFRRQDEILSKKLGFDVTDIFTNRRR